MPTGDVQEGGEAVACLLVEVPIDLDGVQELELFSQCPRRPSIGCPGLDEGPELMDVSVTPQDLPTLDVYKRQVKNLAVKPLSVHQCVCRTVFVSLDK